MFPTRYYGDRFYAPRYFPKVGADPIPGTSTNLKLMGVGVSLLLALLGRW